MINPILRRTISGLSVAALVVLAIIYAPTKWIPHAFAVVIALAIIELWGLTAKKFSRFSLPFFGVFVVGAAFIIASLSVLPWVAVNYGNLMMLYLIFIVKLSDMGGFAFGLTSAKMMKGGNHKLCPKISPNKSWEGLAGSVIGSCLLSVAFMPITHFGPGKALGLGVIAALVGTAGDLIESAFKRWVGVKDSSTFMPAGMGGFLDMFDSLMLAPAILVWFI